MSVKKEEEQQQEFFAVICVEDLDAGTNVYQEFDNKEEAYEYYEEQKELDYESVLLVRVLEESREVVTREEYSFKDVKP